MKKLFLILVFVFVVLPAVAGNYESFPLDEACSHALPRCEEYQGPLEMTYGQYEIDGMYYYILSEEKKEAALVANHKVWESAVDLRMLDTEFPSCFDWSPGTIEGDVIVPETVELDGKVYTVVMIGYGAFYGCDKLKSVKIPSTVRIISNNVFYGCESLESVDIDLETPRYIAPYTDMLQYINKKELDLSNWDSVSFCYGDDSVEVLKLPKIHPDWLIMPVRYLMLGRFSNLRELWSFHEDPVSVMPLDVWDNPDEEYISLFERVTVYVPKGSAEKYRNA